MRKKFISLILLITLLSINMIIPQTAHALFGNKAVVPIICISNNQDNATKIQPWKKQPNTTKTEFYSVPHVYKNPTNTSHKIAVNIGGSTITNNSIITTIKPVKQQVIPHTYQNSINVSRNSSVICMITAISTSGVSRYSSIITTLKPYKQIDLFCKPKPMAYG